LKLIEQIQEDLKRSMKAKDGNRVSVLRFLMSSIRNREIEKRETLDDEEILHEIASSAKRRRESIEAFREGERADLAKKEEAELAILEEYLPKQLPPDEIRGIVQETVKAVGASGPGDLGKVMKELMPRLRGKADGKLVNEIVREILSG
jgi:uncharacterized protein YqeY